MAFHLRDILWPAAPDNTACLGKADSLASPGHLGFVATVSPGFLQRDREGPLFLSPFSFILYISFDSHESSRRFKSSSLNSAILSLFPVGASVSRAPEKTYRNAFRSRRRVKSNCGSYLTNGGDDGVVFTHRRK